MANKKRKGSEPSDNRQQETDQSSKGQYGGLKSLGPGAGRDIEDVTKADVTDLDDAEAPKK